MEFPNQNYRDYNKEVEVEHKNLKRLYQVLSKHEIGGLRMNDECNVKCNSLIYKCLYSQEIKNKDTILQIASFCKQFSM